MSGAPILLAAGGTGGHLFPAEALAQELTARGRTVELVTDERVAGFAKSFPARAVHAVASATIASRAPLEILKAVSRLGLGLGEGLRLVLEVKPGAVVGFGGYPTIPPVGAAQLLGYPTVVHEQNAVLGRANRLLARRARAVGTGFPQLAQASAEIVRKAVHVGNPIRAKVREAAALTFAASADGRTLHLLVFGGSQGARVMSEVVPRAVRRLDAELRERLHIVHQARAEDLQDVVGDYATAGVKAEVSPFFRDLPARMAAAHLVIARAGASTIAELAAIGRPAILVPLPHSLDQDQLANATALSETGGATVIPQHDFTPDRLAALLARLLADPGALARQAADARKLASPDAASKLADLVLGVAAH